MRPVDIGTVVHRRTMALMEKDDLPYWQAFRQILSEDPELCAIYQGTAPVTQVKGPQIPPAKSASHDAGSQIDKLTRQYAAEMNVDYATALRAVLRANPSLTRRYQQV